MFNPQQMLGIEEGEAEAEAEGVGVGEAEGEAEGEADAEAEDGEREGFPRESPKESILFFLISFFQLQTMRLYGFIKNRKVSQ